MHFNGIAVVPGVAQGPLWAPASATAERLDDFPAFDRARAEFVAAAQALPADLRDVYAALALDPMWDDAVSARLTDGLPLADAIAAAARELAAPLAQLEDPYLRARAHDIEQIGAHITRLLGAAPEPPAGAIVCARDVSAVELMQWAPRLAGIALLDIAPTAHVTIVARGLGLPTLALTDAHALDAELAVASNDNPARVALLDGFAGWLETAAGPELLHAHPAQRVIARPDPLPVVAGERTIGVYANVNGPEDALLAAALGADGVGLLRTEFLYADRPAAPTLVQEREAYARVAHAFARRPIVVRTLDLGGDKIGAGMTGDGLDHGMLGIRGLRLTLRQPDLFARHLRAIIEAFATSDLRIMFPMVTFADEFAQARDYVIAAARAGGLVRPPPLGFMLEVPAAAYACDAFARAGASFVSIGTNDLAQYFFASSRLAATNDFDPADDPAFRLFLRAAIERAQAAGLAVGVCGEAAGAPRMSEFWLDCGVDTLSVAPSLVPWLKGRLRGALRQSAEPARAKERA